MGVVSQASTRAALTAALPTLLNGGSLKTYSNDFTPNEQTLLAAFTESAYGGYAAKVIATWGAPFNAPGGGAKSIAPSQQFNGNGAGPNESVYGWYYVDSTGALVEAGRFADAPIPMGDVGTSLVVEPVYITVPIAAEDHESAIGP